MKNSIFTFLFVLITTTSFAQKSGEMYISGNIGAEFGKQKVTLSNGSYSISEDQPLASSFSIGVEYGCFATDNFRLSIAAQIPYSSTPTSKDNNEWLNNSTIGFAINPNIAYYVRISERFYYTPELGAFFEFGNYKQELSSNESYTTQYSGWGTYLTLIAFEFRVNEKIAIGTSIGNISYASVVMKEKDTKTDMTANQFKFSLNDVGVNVRFYF